MEITLTSFLIVCPLLFLAGFVDSIAGGGGIISLPAFLLTGMPPHLALGSNKFSSFMGTTVSTARFFKNGFIDLKLVPPTIVFALLGSLLGANLTLLVPENVIKYLLIFVLPIVAFFVLKKKNFDSEQHTEPISRKKQVIIAILASFVVGCYDGFYGPGTGTFLILIYTILAKMNIKTASGNAKVVNFSSNLAAVTTFIINGKVLFLLSIVAGLFSIAGNFIGSGLVIKNGSKIIRPIIIVVLILLLTKIVIDTL